MLTSEAFNALLKTLEEPPGHVVFVLATTEVLKVPQTILSRCQRFDFARLRSAEAVERMRFICEQEQIEAETDALAVIAAKGEGSMRDALTLLDQVVATGERPLTAEGVRTALGLVDRDLFFRWTTAIREGRTPVVLESLARASQEGANLTELAEELLVHLRNLLLVASDPALLEEVDGTHEEREAYLREAARFEVADLLRFSRLLMESITQMRRSGFPRVHLEVALAEMCALPHSVDLRKFVDAVRSRVGSEADGGASDAGSPASGAPSLGARLPKGPSAPLAGGATSPPEGPDLSVRSRSGNGSGPAPQVGGDSRSEPDRVVDSEPRAETAPGTTAEAASWGEPGVAVSPWERVLAEVARVKPSLQGFLSGSSAEEVEPGVLRVGIAGSPVYVHMLQATENRRILVELVQAGYGRPLGVRFELRTGSAPPAKGRAPATPSPAGADAIQKVVDVFDGDVLGPA
jgi:DNA polymerase-3 subunit gamma/tau